MTESGDGNERVGEKNHVVQVPAATDVKIQDG